MSAIGSADGAKMIQFINQFHVLGPSPTGICHFVPNNGTQFTHSRILVNREPIAVLIDSGQGSSHDIIKGG